MLSIHLIICRSKKELKNTQHSLTPALTQRLRSWVGWGGGGETEPAQTNLESEGAALLTQRQGNKYVAHHT